mgnify:CR=1 FL=1
MEERRQSYDNQPYGSWVEKTLGHVFPVGHPYHHTVIGSMADLSAASLDDVKKAALTVSDKFVAEGPTAEELAAAKSFLKGSYALSLALDPTFLSAARLVTEATSFGGVHTTAERRADPGEVAPLTPRPYLDRMELSTDNGLLVASAVG